MIAARPLSRLRGSVSDPLLSSAYSLMANVVVTTALGVVFWVAAARLYSAASVGRDAALLAALVELSTICQLNLVNGITRFFPSLERGTARALLGAYAVTGVAALILGVGFVLITPNISGQFRFIGEDLALAVLYVVAQVLWTWFSLQDAALTAMRRAPWVPVENGTFGVLKIVALPLLVAVGSAHGVFLAAVLPVILLLIPVNLYLFRTAIPEHLRTRRPSASLLQRLSRRMLLRFMAQDWGATVLAQASTTALPLLVVALLGSAANAHFYIPYTIVVTFTLFFYGACTSLVVEGGLAEDRVRAMARKIVRLFMLTVVPGTVVMVAAAPLILLPFGGEYARQGAPVLRILACGGLLRAASTLYIAISRVQGKGFRILAVDGLQAALLILGAATLAKPLGLDGIALSWLGAVGVVSLAVVPSLVRFFCSPELTVPVQTDPSHYPSEEVAIP